MMSGPLSTVVRVEDLERAFPNRQGGGTRLVLTQSTYTMQKLVEAVPAGARIVATAQREALETNAGEAFRGRGPWRFFEITKDTKDTDTKDTDTKDTDTNDTKDTKGTKQAGGKRGISHGPRFVPSPIPPEVEYLIRAFDVTDADERLRLCRTACELAPSSAVCAVALASACRETQDLAGARAALDQTLHLAPEWEAAHYEDGKFWLACEDMERACAAFARAASLMPTFSAASSNLGAALGELDRPDAALEAFEQALAADPDSFTVLNNIGVVSRELGRLTESERALRRVIALEPGFVFGYYNLGHTLFLAGRYQDALGAYEEGQRRDPQKNRRQGCRLAMARFATGDRAGAARDLWHFADAASDDERRELLAEAAEIAQALVSADAGLARQGDFVDEIRARAARA